MAWKPSVPMVSLGNLCGMSPRLHWLQGSYMLPQHGGDSSTQPSIESVINKAQRYGYLPSSFENVHTVVLSIIWNLNSSIVFCLIRGMSCINYYLLKRILDIACGNVLITLLCLSPMIIWSGRIFCTECYLRIPIRCMCRCMFYLLVLCANWLILVYRIFLIRWICSFLTDRQQCVKLRDVFSSWVQLSGSMPQGSY